MPDFIEIPVRDLELDSENPRLPSHVKGQDEDCILVFLARQTNIDELIASIGTNGFFEGEPIIVLKNPDSDTEHVVLEGNRRVTALKLLSNQELANGISTRVSNAVNDAEYRPRKIRAYRVDSREEVLQYLGFRHVSGVQRWDPLAKARYLELLYRHSQGDPNSRYVQIAREIGSRQDTVRKNLDALASYNIVVENDFFNIDSLNEITFQFGVFYTAIGYPSIATFVGARNLPGQPTHPIEDKTRIMVETTQELVRWMFVKEASGETRLGESRNLGQLAAVVKTPSALGLLRNGVSLEDAFNQTPDIQNEFIVEVKSATGSLDEAIGKIGAIDAHDEEVLDSISELRLRLDIIVERLGL